MQEIQVRESGTLPCWIWQALDGSQVKLWTSFYIPNWLISVLLHVIMYCSSIWKIAEVRYPGKIGPIRLPSKVEFCVIDESYGNIRQSGPIPVTFGETISIVQKKPDDAPTVTLIYEEAPRGKNNVINEGGNAKPIFVIRVPSKPLIVFLSQKPFYSQPTELLLLVIWCLLVLISLFLFTSGDAIN